MTDGSGWISFHQWSIAESLGAPQYDDTKGDRCPVAIARTVAAGFGPAVGDGPVYAVGFGTRGIIRYGGGRVIGDGWHFVKVLWVARPTYDGPITIRGRQTNGPNTLLFELGTDQPVSDVIALPAGDGGVNLEAPGWRFWPSYTLVRRPGCYAYDISGTSFHETMTQPARL